MFDDGDAFTEVVFVLDPVQVDAEAGELFGPEVIFFEEGTKGLNDLGGGGGCGRFSGVIDLKDHDGR